MKSVQPKWLKLFSILMPVTLLVIVLGFLWKGLSLNPQHLPSAMLNKTLPEFVQPTVENPNKTISHEVLRGKISLLHVWASWCPTCAVEHKTIKKLANQGVVIYGLNYKDDLLIAQKWLKREGNPYQANVFDPEGKLAIELGVYGAPETYLVDHNGIIRLRHAGMVTNELWQSKFLPVIQSIQSEGVLSRD